MKFSDKVYDLVLQIPEGKVATYGQIASMITTARSARYVGFALRGLGTNERNVPWWRVVSKSGYISINHGKGGAEKYMQRDLLLDEGIEIDDDLVVNMEKHLWKF